jgi:hypothetical protein
MNKEYRVAREAQNRMIETFYTVGRAHVPAEQPAKTDTREPGLW